MNTTKTNPTVKVETYLFFDGRCEEALEFYRRALGAEVDMMMRFKDNPEPATGCQPAGAENKIMHASFRIGQTHLMASDGRCTGSPKFDGFSVSISAPNEAEAKRLFAAVGEGGQVLMPLSKTFYSPAFGMVTDKFGVMWMVIVPVSPA